jgi:phosphoribosyl-ATP pyrophosphohydrolase
VSNVLARLGSEIDARRLSDASESYTASLFAKGEDAILKKVGEEAVEFVLAAKGNDLDHLVAEAADVWFHMLVLLSTKGLGPSDILNELQRREGVSGIAEKAARVSD